MELKLYTHPLSQPARALIIFCKLHGIEFEEIVIDLFAGQHKSPEFLEINPVGQIPVMVHGDFKLTESHAILAYLASVFPGVADHWYPTDVRKRAKIDSVLHWHHSHLRRGAVMYVLNSKLFPIMGQPVNPQDILEDEKILHKSLSLIETFWLTDNELFLVGGDKPSIADLSLVCEILEFEILDEDDQNRFLKPYKKVEKWIENVRNALNPQFDDVHNTLHECMRNHAKPKV